MLKVSVHHGNIVHRVSNVKAELKILFQSPKLTKKKDDDAIALYCIVNVLSQVVHYDWHTPKNELSLPSTPVVYVNAPGVYFCTVSYQNEVVTSHCFEIEQGS